MAVTAIIGISDVTFKSFYHEKMAVLETDNLSTSARGFFFFCIQSAAKLFEHLR